MTRTETTGGCPLNRGAAVVLDLCPASLGSKNRGGFAVLTARRGPRGKLCLPPPPRHVFHGKVACPPAWTVLGCSPPLLGPPPQRQPTPIRATTSEASENGTRSAGSRRRSGGSGFQVRTRTAVLTARRGSRGKLCLPPPLGMSSTEGFPALPLGRSSGVLHHSLDLLLSGSPLQYGPPPRKPRGTGPGRRAPGDGAADQGSRFTRTGSLPAGQRVAFAGKGAFHSPRRLGSPCASLDGTSETPFRAGETSAIRTETTGTGGLPIPPAIRPRDFARRDKPGPRPRGCLGKGGEGRAFPISSFPPSALAL